MKLASLSARGRRGPDFAGIVRKLVPLLGLSLLTGVPLSALEPPKAELFGGYSFLRSDRNDYRRRNFQGWNLSLARSINHRVEIVGDFDGHYGGIAGASTSFRSASLLFGPRISYRGYDRLTPSFQVLAGVARSTLDLSALGLAGISRSSFAFAVGGGLDLTVSRRFAIRLIEADYSLASFGGGVCPAVFPPPRDCGSVGQSALRISGGFVLRLGTR